MILIQVSETTIINVDNVTHVERWSDTITRVYFNTTQGAHYNEDIKQQAFMDLRGEEGEALWERLSMAERSGNAGQI